MCVRLNIFSQEVIFVTLTPSARAVQSQAHVCNSPLSQSIIRYPVVDLGEADKVWHLDVQVLHHWVLALCQQEILNHVDNHWVNACV